MGFLDGPERERAGVYVQWLEAQKPAGPQGANRFYGDMSEAALADLVRHVLVPHGALRPDATDTEYVEAARDAYEAEIERRRRRAR